MIADIRFRLQRPEQPERLAAWRERLAMPVLIDPDVNRIWGPDTSHWDGNVDFDVTAQMGAKFAIVKAMDGTVPTPYFLSNFQRAKAAKLLVSGYHWLYPDRAISCALQAERVHNLTKDLGMTLPLVVDFEWTRYAGQQANPGYDDLRKFVLEYIRLSGSKPVLYSAAGYMNVLGYMPDDLRMLFAGFWWATYGPSPTLPLGFVTWDMWQFTSAGDAQRYAPGDKGKLELDLNYMTEEFYRRFSGGGTTDPAPGGITMQYKVIWSNGVARRMRPSTTNSYTGLTYQYEQVVDVVEENIPDADDPTNENKMWVKFADGLFGAADYPDSTGVPRIRMTKIDPVPVPALKPFTLKVDGFKEFSGNLEPE